MEECKIGGVQGWKSVRVEECNIGRVLDGRVLDWKSGRVEECDILKECMIWRV